MKTILRNRGTNGEEELSGKEKKTQLNLSFNITSCTVEKDCYRLIAVVTIDPKEITTETRKMRFTFGFSCSAVTNIPNRITKFNSLTSAENIDFQLR